MKLVDSAIRYPVTVTVGVLLVVLFGFLSLFRIPVQLIPEVQEPQVIVTTTWPGASPEEIETEIVQEQEDQLKSLEGLVEMTSQSRESQGTVTLKFQVGADPDSALLDVNNKPQQVPEYPQNALQPVLTTQDPREAASAWLILQALPDSDVEVELQREFAEEIVKPRLERVPGVASSQVMGGRDREMQVIVDPQKLTVRNLTISQVAAALDAENSDVSAGDFDEGKRTYVVRSIGEYRSTEDIESVVLAWRDGAPVYVRDVATVTLGYEEPTALVKQKGERSMAISVARQTGSNTLTVMQGVQEEVERLNSGILQEQGLQLSMAFSEADYIDSAIALVQRNIVIGGVLAVSVLLLFLRSISSTFVIGLAIPVSVVGTFLAMTLLGRNINVVSLAGLAFAVGLIVDASIVVLENIYRHMQMGKGRRQAAYDGAVEVWGAVLASVLTTVAVFLPVLFVEQEAGQLFRDIAVAVSAAVLISLVVSITVIPSLAARILHAVPSSERRQEGRAQGHDEHGWRDLWGLIEYGRRFNELVGDFIFWLAGSVTLRLVVIFGLTFGALGLAWTLMPDTEYLPTGNQNFAFGVIIPPAGLNLGEYEGMAEHVERELRPYWEARPGSPEAAELEAPPIEHFFFVAPPGNAFMGAISYPEYALQMGQFVPVMQRVIGDIPGTFGVVQQPSIFQRGEEGRGIDVDITGPDLVRILELGSQVFGQVMQVIPGAQAQPIPGLDLGNPEVRVVIDRERAAELGLTAREIGFALNALVDGVKVSEYQYRGRAIDLVLQGVEGYASRSQDIQGLDIATPTGRTVSIGDVGWVVSTTGPQQINHIERQRAVTIQVIPPPQYPLETAMRDIEAQILEPMRASGQLAGLYEANLSGTADKLTETRLALQGNFILALIVTYLLMSALFESFLYPFVILFSVPFAAVGGFVGLAAVNAFIAYQALDVVAMLGFVILIGIVVNAAILIVHQTLNYMRDRGMSHREALREAVTDRIRPIFMSTTTSVMGMSPLILATGAGSEIYRGLGSVVVGGLILSTLFTLLLVPAVFSMAMDAQRALKRLLGVGDEEGEAEARAEA